MREPLGDWQAAADHVNSLRRLIDRLRVERAPSWGALPDDWNTVWPDRPGGLARGPDPDLIASDGLERASAPWGDVRWERRQVAHHLTSWLVACHVGRVVRWDEDAPSIRSNTGSLLGELGSLLAGSLEDGMRIRSCTGSLRGRPCRITWTVVHDKPRPKAPMLCDGCYALHRQRESQSKPKGEQP